MAEFTKTFNSKYNSYDIVAFIPNSNHKNLKRSCEEIMEKYATDMLIRNSGISVCDRYKDILNIFYTNIKIGIIQDVYFNAYTNSILYEILYASESEYIDNGNISKIQTEDEKDRTLINHYTEKKTGIRYATYLDKDVPEDNIFFNVFKVPHTIHLL